MIEPRQRTHLCIGILVDVSRAMVQSLGGNYERLQTFGEKLGDFQQQGDLWIVSPLPKINCFAYGFGFDKRLDLEDRLMLGVAHSLRNAFTKPRDREPTPDLSKVELPVVRDLMKLPKSQASTVDILDLVDNWNVYRDNVISLRRRMLGDETPMREAFEIARQRITTEIEKKPIASVLLVLSGGMPTDTNGSNNSVYSVIREIQETGTIVATCFVTDAVSGKARRLYTKHQNDWPEVAKLMFDCASEIQEGTSLYSFLQEQGWEVEHRAKLFAQVTPETLFQVVEDVLIPFRKKTELASPAVAISKPSTDRRSRLMFVHGLGGRAQCAWGRLPEFLMADREMAARFSVGFYSFPVSFFGLPLSGRRSTIQWLAENLRAQIGRDSELRGRPKMN